MHTYMPSRHLPRTDLPRLMGDISPPTGGALTVGEAVETMRERKVITAAQSAALWELPETVGSDVLPCRAAIERCAQENARGADWRCVYLSGRPIRDFAKSAWMQREKEDEWAAKARQPGYYLINVHGQYPKMSWRDQEENIAKLGKRYARVPEALLAECILTFFRAFGERLLPNWYHWGPSRASNGEHVCVGSFDERRGLDVGTYVPSGGDSETRVCIYQACAPEE